MTERFPEQRNRSAQRRADAPEVPDRTLPVFDESFVAAAVIHEPSAQARALLAQPLPKTQQPVPQPAYMYMPLPHCWSVRPSHHLAALRMSAVTAIACVMAITALLVIMLR